MKSASVSSPGPSVADNNGAAPDPLGPRYNLLKTGSTEHHHPFRTHIASFSLIAILVFFRPFICFAN